MISKVAAPFCVMLIMLLLTGHNEIYVLEIDCLPVCGYSFSFGK
jgi:hypothetical protein